jgi:hypothetical protein
MAKQPSARIVSITPDVGARIVAVVSPGAPPPVDMSMPAGDADNGAPPPTEPASNPVEPAANDLRKIS